MQNENVIKSNINVDVDTGALILIDILFEKKLIDRKTYNKIQEKYNPKYKINNQNH